MKRIYFYQLLCFLMSIGLCMTQPMTLQAQEVYHQYFDGEVYVKLANVADIPNHTNKQVGLDEYDFLRSATENFGIYKIERPFRHTKSDKLTTVLRVFFNQADKVEDFIALLEKNDQVTYAEKVPLMRQLYTPNDLPSQAGNGYHLYQVEALEAWDISQGSADIRVAIVDDGMAIGHVDLDDAVWVNEGEIPDNGIDDDENGRIDDVSGFDVADNDNDPTNSATQTHGTHVSGIACAETDNGSGIASMGFNTKFLPIRGSTSNVAITDGYEGLTYSADAGADVVNLSWGGAGASATETNVVNYVYEAGTIIVAAAGNFGDQDNPIFYPASYDHVIAVGAVNNNDIKAGYSEYGDWIDVSAPGAIYSTVPGDTYEMQIGTSQASPIVAGLCGLMLSLEPTLSFEQIESCLKSSADNIDDINPNFAGQMGAGRINAKAAMECVQELLISPPLPNIASNFTEICPGFDIEFAGSSTSGILDSISWIFVGGSPSESSELNPSVTYESEGVYDVYVTGYNQFGEETQIFSSYVNILEAPEVSFDVVNNGLEVTFTNTTTDPATSFFWNFGDGDAGFGETATHTYSEEGVYEVCLKAFADCNAELCEQIDIKITGIDDTDIKIDFELSPNPANNEIQLAWQNTLSETTSMSIYSITGVLQQQKQLPAGTQQTTWNVADLASGLYLVKVGNQTLKWVKN
ncbi:MAG: S8 family serine peptidase [Chitinophagales bacterium]